MSTAFLVGCCFFSNTDSSEMQLFQTLALVAVAVNNFVELETLKPLPKPLLLGAVVRNGSSGEICFKDRTMSQSVDDQVSSMISEDILPQILPCNKKNIGLVKHCPGMSCQEVLTIHYALLTSGGNEDTLRGSLGQFWIQARSGGSVKLNCSVVREVCGERIGGWARIGALNMTDPGERCPPSLQEISAFGRSCQRTNHSSHSGAGCSSLYFPTQGFNFSEICGRIIGFQYGPTTAFKSYHDSLNRSVTVSINDVHVDGVSLTFGHHRDHIWTLASARGLQYRDTSVCPCTGGGTSSPTNTVPPWVGTDYFCDTAANITWETIRGSPHIFFPGNKLWDGEDCWGNSTCCEFNSPPWFHRQFGGVGILDYVELRLCGSNYLTGTPVQLIEIFVK